MKIVIEVSGGMVQDVYTDVRTVEGVDYVVIDRDAGTSVESFATTFETPTQLESRIADALAEAEEQKAGMPCVEGDDGEDEERDQT